MPLLIRIGYWKGDRARDWPDVTSFVDPVWEVGERELVTEHLSRGHVARAYMGFSTCRICGVLNGSLELTDGTYLWPEGLSHYVGVHDVRMPSAFVRHVIRWREHLEEADVEEDAWRRAEPDWTPLT